MSLLDHHTRMFAYDRWANAEVIAALRNSDPPPPRSLRFMAHLLAAERLWLGRLQRDPTPVAVWPDLTLAQCEARQDEMARLWPEYLGALRESSLGERVEYVNSKGEPWRSAVGDILTHVVTHSAYHRGQIATDMRAAGATPPYTDFIHAVRKGLVP